MGRLLQSFIHEGGFIVKIITVCVGSAGTNAYILHDKQSLTGVVIDPGADALQILAEITKRGLDIGAILLTHAHFDHIGAADEVAEKLGIPIYASEYEAHAASDPNLNGAAYFRRSDVMTTAVDILMPDTTLDIGDSKLQIIHTPGHTQGSLCFYAPAEGALFSGDTLFRESYGRYDLPSGDFAALKQSLAKLLALPESTTVYPGHGSTTTIGHERIHNERR